jgi:hypothetical protein
MPEEAPVTRTTRFRENPSVPEAAEGEFVTGLSIGGLPGASLRKKQPKAMGASFRKNNL